MFTVWRKLYLYAENFIFSCWTSCLGIIARKMASIMAEVTLSHTQTWFQLLHRFATKFRDQTYRNVNAGINAYSIHHMFALRREKQKVVFVFICILCACGTCACQSIDWRNCWRFLKWLKQEARKQEARKQEARKREAVPHWELAGSIYNQSICHLFLSLVLIRYKGLKLS